MSARGLASEFLLILYKTGKYSLNDLNDISTLMVVKDPREVALALEGLPEPAEPSPDESPICPTCNMVGRDGLGDCICHAPIPAEDRDEYKQRREEREGQEVEIRGETWTVRRHVRGSLYLLVHPTLGQRYASHSNQKGWRWWVNNTGIPLERRLSPDGAVRATRKDKGTNKREKPQLHYSQCCHTPHRHMSHRDGFCAGCRDHTPARRAALRQYNLEQEGADF